MDQFWRTDEQFAKFAPHLSGDTRGMARVDDQRVSSVVHVLKGGGRWADAPREVHLPQKALYNRFVHCAAKSVWAGLFERLAQAGGPPTQVPIGSSTMKAHRYASGAEGGNCAAS